MEKGSECILSSGNILTKSIAWKKGNDAPDDEIYESLKSSLEGKKELSRVGNVLEIFGEDVQNNNEETVDRQELKVSLKVFLYSSEKTDLLTAIERGLKNASAEYFDTLVITFAGRTDGIPLTLEVVQNTWSILEEMVHQGKVKTIGLSDVETQIFIQLHEWATVKPGIIQINLAACCVVPQELSDFCKLQGIQLLTHSDPVDALSAEKLQLLTEELQSCNQAIVENLLWKLKWVLRYQVQLKCRGVLAKKGYTASLQQTTVLKN